MTDADRSRADLHTKVWRSSDLLGSCRELIAHEIATRKLTVTSLAKTIGLNRHSLAKKIAGQRPFYLKEFLDLCAAMRIDLVAAICAVERLEGWQSYYDEGLRIALGLVKPFVIKIGTSTTAAIEPLTAPAQEQLAKRIADTVIENQQQIRDRRERLNDLPRI